MNRKEQLKKTVSEKALLRGDFVLSSGARSTFYIDLRRVSLSSEGVSLIAELVLDTLESGPPVEMIGGPTIGADPIVGAVAALSRSRGRGLDAFLVRKASKDHGTKSKVEGPSVEGKAVAVIDDVGTTGGSLLTALEAARDAGANVVRAMVVLDRLEGAREAVGGFGLDLESLLTLKDIMD
jgi:orotate phosphoribosyltransferase